MAVDIDGTWQKKNRQSLNGVVIATAVIYYIYFPIIVNAPIKSPMKNYVVKISMNPAAICKSTEQKKLLAFGRFS